MDKQIKRHLERRGVRLAYARPPGRLLGSDGGLDAFLKWFHEGVMRFDSMEYRRRFWHEAYRNGYTIGHMPHTALEFTDPRRHTYNAWLANLAVLVVAMGASAIMWYLVRTLDAHIRRLRRPTYYETERTHRMGLAEERRQIRRRSTTSACPTPDMLRAAFAQARVSTVSMIRFGSMLEDMECYVDNSVVWSKEEGRIVGRRGGIRQWLRENAPDLSEHYKTVMKYKALAKKFRQAVGVSDPVPAAAVLPPDLPEGSEKGEGNGEVDRREYCSERDRSEQGNPCNGNGGNVSEFRKNGKTDGDGKNGDGKNGDGKNGDGNGGRTSKRVASVSDVKAKTPEVVARDLLAACEGTVASLAAQLALMVSADFVPDENIGRTRVAHDGRRSRSPATRRLRGSRARHGRNLA